jgi:acetyl esterase/lipase
MTEPLSRIKRPRPLLRATLELINAANGFRPLGRKGYPTLAAFWFGWPTSEVPGYYLGASLLDVVRRGLRGDFRGRRGSVALSLTALSWGVLAIIYRRNARTPQPILKTALVDGLGANYTDAFASLPTTPSRSGRPSVWRTTSARRRFVESEQVIRYGPHGRANLADVWRHRDLPRDGKAPVLVQVPGGAWALGWRRPQAYPLMSHLADQGWIIVAVNYRVSPRNRWPDHIVDVKRVLAWVKENIAEYGGDPNFVAITGGSAGGHLAALAALTPGDPQWQPGFEDADTSVAAAVPVYGRYDWFSSHGDGRREFLVYLEKLVVKRSITKFRNIYTDASPICRVHADAPPFFILHGSYDSIIPVREGREFAAAMRNSSAAPVLYAELPGAQHAFDIFPSPRARHSADAVSQFLSWVYATTHKPE